MDADFAIELGSEDPVLDFPWKDPDARLAYYDLKRHPELLASVSEANEYPELSDFLRAVNSPRSDLESAKSDVWATRELSAAEEIYDSELKFAAYVDLLFSKVDIRHSLPAYQSFVKEFVELLRRTPDTPSAVEICVRRCYFGSDSGVQDGFYFTLYVSGYGHEEGAARLNWAVAMKLTANAIVQLSNR